MPSDEEKSTDEKQQAKNPTNEKNKRKKHLTKKSTDGQINGRKQTKRTKKKTFAEKREVKNRCWGWLGYKQIGQYYYRCRVLL